MEEKNKRAIVLGSRSVNATGLIRSLGEAGIPVTFASVFGNIESKYNSFHLTLSRDEMKMKREIIEYCSRFSEKPIIFPTDDEIALFLDNNYDELKDYCIFSNATGKLNILVDKSVQGELARSCGLNVPFSKEINLDNIELPERFPVIIKPNSGVSGSKGDIRVCYTKEEYYDTMNTFSNKNYGSVLVQYFLDEPNQYEIGIMGVALPDGTVVIPGVIHKLRSYPSKRGSTSYAKIENDFSCVDVNSIKEFVRNTDYIGIFDIEMIVSSGVAWFIEINFRNGQYGYSITKAGYNLPANLCRGMLGEHIDSVKPLREIYYMNERDDYLHVKNGELSKKIWKKQFSTAKAYGMFCKTDIRPYIRQYIKIPDRVVIGFGKLKARLKDLLFKEEWTLAIRKRQDKLLFETGGTDKPFFIIKNSLRYWAADPFLISKDDKDYIFFEMFDRLKGKGLIGYRVIENGKISKMKVAYEHNTHLSFPFVFEHEGDFYMMPESSKDHTLPILKAKSFPDKWEIVSNLNNGERFVDSVLFEHKGSVYLFTQQIQNSYSFDKLDVYITESDKLVAHKCNSVVVSHENARLAGKVFRLNDSIIRVSQDCSADYGRKLTFNKITELSPNIYSEEKLKEIEVADISLDAKNDYCGTHTYNQNENYEIIDLKNKTKLKLFNVFNIFYRVFKK